MIALSLAALVVFAGIASLTGGQSAQADSPEPDYEENHVQELRTLLNSGQLSDAGRESLQAKLEMAERMAAERQAARNALQAGPREKVISEEMRVFSAPEQPQPAPEGIFEGSEGLVRPSLAQINNTWQAERSGSLYQVFAGSLPDQPEQGLLIVSQIAPDRPVGEREVYLAPSNAGSLRILSVDGQTLRLEGASGMKLSFDLDSRTYQE